MKRTIWSTVGILVLFLAWYIAADRMTPITGNARVKAVLTPMVPQVSGLVTEVLVENGQVVTPGDVMVRIDRRPYEIEKARAEANLESAVQEVGASSAEVRSAQAKVTRTQADLDTKRLQAERVYALEKKGLVPTAQADQTRGELAEAEAQLGDALGELDRAKERLGVEGEENPKIQAAMAALAEAELDLEWTELKAPSTGVVSNLLIAPGVYARSGSSLLTFIDAKDIWVEAYMTENNMGLAKVGSPVDVVLDLHPGRVVTGVVESFSAGVAVSGADEAGELASAPSTTGFLREPERFPVRIILPGYEVGSAEDDLRFQLNGQADVIMYLTDGTMMNAIGRAYIKAVSILSYAF